MAVFIHTVRARKRGKPVSERVMRAILIAALLAATPVCAGPLTNEQAQRIFDQAFPPYHCQFWIKGMRDPFAEIRIDLDRPEPWTVARNPHGIVLTRGNIEIVVNYSVGFRDGGSAVLRIDGKDDTNGVCEKER